jgi:uncharacterized membrane protein YeaQ/YmgE (transglycosylase-associated protein family)
LRLHGYPQVIASVFLVIAKGGKGAQVDIGSILGYILVGIVVGVLARFLVPGRSRIGFIGTIVVGVIGAIGGGWLAGAVFPETAGVDWIASILVAVVLVLLLKAASKRRFL